MNITNKTGFIALALFLFVVFEITACSDNTSSNVATPAEQSKVGQEDNIADDAEDVQQGGLSVDETETEQQNTQTDISDEAAEEESKPVVLSGESPKVNDDGTLPAKIYVALATDEHRKYELDFAGRCIVPCVGKRKVQQKIVNNSLDFVVEQLFLKDKTTVALGSFRVGNIEVAEDGIASTVEVEIEVYVGDDGTIGIKSRDALKNAPLEVENL